MVACVQAPEDESAQLLGQEDDRGEVEEGLLGLDVLDELPLVDGRVEVVDVTRVPLELEDYLSVLGVFVVEESLHSVVDIGYAVYFEGTNPLDGLFEFLDVEIEGGELKLSQLHDLHLLVDFSEPHWVLLPQEEVDALLVVLQSLISQQELSVLLLHLVQPHNQLIQLQHA